jgi:hypothetical protein
MAVPRWGPPCGRRAVRHHAGACVDETPPRDASKAHIPSALGRADDRLCAARSSSSKSAACRSRRASRKPSGSDGIHLRAERPIPKRLRSRILDRAWCAYVRRFRLEHTVRFRKQTLNWTIPWVRHPTQADRWTWLVVLACTQLRLARLLVGDQPLPRKRSQPAGELIQSRVQSALLSSCCPWLHARVRLASAARSQSSSAAACRVRTRAKKVLPGTATRARFWARHPYPYPLPGRGHDPRRVFA